MVQFLSHGDKCEMFFWISVNMSILEYEHIHLCTIQDIKIFGLLLSTFQNPEQTKSC